uniref:Uncharacterized protein n=1 Tax=Kwoniella dejecticola CBS 10117 TaxID=1296121 RepID=A0A1A6A9L4_9TREE|nr:uncharacterized protein I303_02758 [Kwoniella dejecticola CBS 10117]OBR86744.1 hypothetical protein I303_02758 [Kwoniella dejecticola CBS 10117]
MPSIPIISTPGAGPSSVPSSPRPESPNLDATRPRRRGSLGRLSKLVAPGRSRSTSNASQISVNQEDSGESSGSTTPEFRRRAGKVATTSLLASDARYKKFAQSLDKSLQTFESVNEWADFISFLSRLLKTLQAPSPSYPEIPRKLVVSKRLAQCLNPALPAGVHQRALDVYAYIFNIIGIEGLKRDLLIWSSGLFPFFQFATTSVRPVLINIYETYYLPLGADLRPAAKAFVLALLPGMEEETGDFFDKILHLLDKLSEAITPSFFLKNVFLNLISSPQSRLSALNYLSRRLLKPPEEDPQDVGLIIRGVSAVLTDENVLVRRHGLDLLLRILKIDEPLFENADHKDQEILIRSASSVVLQRELSLSRRVYTWLLGPSEISAEQVAYFKENSLDLLAGVLQDDMALLDGSVDGPDALRPFKIFLSLLDKWEVGGSLSERLAIPALRTIKNATTEGQDLLNEEVIGTALAVYEAIEPIVVWRLLHMAVQAELGAKESDAIDLVQWLLASVPQHDEEVTSVHIPVMLESVFGVISSNTLTADALLEALRLSVPLLDSVSSTTLAKASKACQKAEVEEQSAADSLYRDNGNLQQAYDRIHQDTIPRVTSTAFEICEVALSNHAEEPETLLSAIKILTILIDQEVPTLASINGAGWLSCMVQALSKVSSFAVVEAVVTAALKASRCSAFSPAILLTSDQTISTILDALFRYLRSDASPYHVRAVELLWEFNQLAEVHTLENVIARRLGSKPFDGPAFDAFGVLWRLTDDSMLPGEIFNIPVSMVLDALQSTDPDVQRQAETWMRLNLRSYFRVLDPILSRLLDPSIKYHQNTYLHPIDLNFVRHLVDSVSLLLKFGGQGLSKACHSTEIRQSVHPTLVTRATDAFPNDTSYLEILVSTMIRFIDTDGSSSMRKVASLFIRVQSSAIQLLQTIVSRGDTSEPQIGYVRKSIVNQLSVAVQNRHLTLQSKLLHLLHSTITAATANKALHHRRSPSLNEKNHHVRPDADFEISLVKLIVEAVSSTGNMPVLQHWVDFVLMTLPQFSTSSGLLQALSECFSQQLRYLSIHLDSVYIRSAASVNDEKLLVTEAEVVMILNTLERIVILLAGGPNAKHEDLGKQGEGEKGLLGLMSGVFTVEAPAYEIPKTEYPRYLDDAVHALLVSWTITKTTVNSSSISSKALAYGTIRSRVSKVLEKIFKVQPFGLITSCIHVWATNSKEITDSAIFECVDTLTPSAQRLVEIVCDAASGKSGRMSSEFRSDPAYLAFLEAYISRLEAPIAVQVWSTLFSFAKDLTGSVGSSAARVQLYLVLRCLTALALTVSKTSALEDRRLRRDVQDTYSKVLDLVVTNASKIAEIGLWSRLSPGTPSQDDIEKIAVEKGLDQIYDFLSSRVLPNIRSLLIDADRVNATCSGMMVSVITPALRRQHVEASILRLLLEITKIPSAIKTWRVQISDVFNDSRFFRSTTEDDVGYWKSLICGLMDSDKERFGDLLAKITAASSANIFSNREQEMSVKSLNLRRLSFVLLAAETNHHLVQLPAIQEKLVEMLRSHQVSPRVHSEVYLCLRVLMCRISPQHLTNFWPVILSELLRIFEVTMDDPPADGSEDLQLVLAACKFLDILLVIQSEDFQVHQWMFVTDTSDAVYPSENHSPEAIMDCLSILFSEGSRVTNGGKHERALVLAEQPENAPRRPRLSGIRTLDSIYQLQPFFSRASIDTFEGVFGGMGVDWDAVEDGLNREIFDA